MIMLHFFKQGMNFFFKAKRFSKCLHCNLKDCITAGITQEILIEEPQCHISQFRNFPFFKLKFTIDNTKQS